MSDDRVSEFAPWKGQQARNTLVAVADEAERAFQRIDPGTGLPFLEHNDLQRIAALVVSLTYADMKALAAGIHGSDDAAETVILADKLHAWADKTRAKP